ARVAISQNAKPASIEDAEVAIANLESEKASIARERDLGAANEERILEIDGQIAEKREKLEALKGDWDNERKLVEEILALREKISKASAPKAAEPVSAAPAAPAAEPAALAGDPLADGETLHTKVGELGKIDPEKRMIYAHVDEQAIAAVVSDWTGIPVGKMVADEIETVLHLADILNRRIVGQTHGLEMIAKRIETNRASRSASSCCAARPASARPRRRSPSPRRSTAASRTSSRSTCRSFRRRTPSRPSRARRPAMWATAREGV